MVWTATDSLRLSVVLGLRKGLSLCRGMRRQLSEEEQQWVAEAIITHLKLSNYRIEQGPPLQAHGRRHP